MPPLSTGVTEAGRRDTPYSCHLSSWSHNLTAHRPENLSSWLGQRRMPQRHQQQQQASASSGPLGLFMGKQTQQRAPCPFAGTSLLSGLSGIVGRTSALRLTIPLVPQGPGRAVSLPERGPALHAQLPDAQGFGARPGLGQG